MAAEYRLSCQTKNTCYSWLNTPSRERGAGEAAPVGLKNTPVSCPSQDLSRRVIVAPGICARTIRCQNEKLTGKERLRSNETRKDTRRPGDRRRDRDQRALRPLGCQRHSAGGQEAMVQAMNAKAQALGMLQTRYADASGLDSGNVSTARDLTRLVAETRNHELLHILTTTASFRITDRASGREFAYHNTNRLLRKETWDIALSKTGYTAAAGNCLLMQATIANRPLTIVLLDSWGKLSRYGDANRIHQWLQKAERRVPPIITARAAPG